MSRSDSDLPMSSRRAQSGKRLDGVGGDERLRAMSTMRSVTRGVVGLVVAAVAIQPGALQAQAFDFDHGTAACTVSPM